MPVSGITYTTERGQLIVASSQNLTAASATAEGLVIDGSGNGIRASGTATIILLRCNIFMNLAGSDGSNPTISSLSYNGDDSDRTVTTRHLILRGCSVVLNSTQRQNVFLSEMTDCHFYCVDDNQTLFVYTQPGAIVNNTKFSGTNVWEVVGPPAQAGGLVFENVLAAFFNYQAGRLDFTGITILSFTRASCFMGSGNGGNNTVYNWDPTTFDRTKVSRSAGNNAYIEGISASFIFADRDAGTLLPNVLVVYRDNRSGSYVEHGRYVSNSIGRMTGTYDSRFDTTGAAQERVTLFMETFFSVDNSSGGAYTAPNFDGSAGVRYDLQTVTPRLEIRSYLHEAPAAYGPTSNYPFTTAQGETNGDFSLKSSVAFALAVDSGITQTNMATVMAYTTVPNLDQLYDRAKAEWRTNDGYALPLFTGSTIDFGATNIVFDATAGSAYLYSAGTATIKTTTMQAGTKFISIKTTGTITFSNGAIPGPLLVYRSSAGTSVPITAPNLIDNTRVQIYNVTDSVELLNSVVAGGAGFVGRVNWSTDKAIELRAAYCQGLVRKLPVRTPSTLTALGSTFADQQVDGPVYTANGIDGSAVTEFAPDYPNIRVDISAAGGVTSVKRLFAWFCYTEQTAAGVAQWFGGMMPDDSVNYKIVTATLNLKLDNITGTPVLVIDGRLYRDDGTTVIYSGSGSIQMDPNRVYGIATTGPISPTDKTDIVNGVWTKVLGSGLSADGTVSTTKANADLIPAAL